MIEEENKEFNKKEAQILSFQLECFIKALLKFCYYYYDNENMDCIILVLKHINKLTSKLYCALEGWEIYDEALIGKKDSSLCH